MTDLLPCPFCGGEATVERMGHNGYYFVACSGLNCCDSALADTEAEAIAAWNSRSERTCHIEYPYYGDAPVINGLPRCSECKTEFAVGTFPNYCLNCGAKVIGESE